MYNVAVRYRDGVVGEYVTAERDSLYALCYTLSTSEEALEYMVSESGDKVSREDMGYHNMKKWVMQFDYTKPLPKRRK